MNHTLHYFKSHFIDFFRNNSLWKKCVHESHFRHFKMWIFNKIQEKDLSLYSHIRKNMHLQLEFWFVFMNVYTDKLLFCTTSINVDSLLYKHIYFCTNKSSPPPSMALQPIVGPWPPLRVSWLYYDVGYQLHDRPGSSQPDSTTRDI
jgi:hypothetical protein